MEDQLKLWLSPPIFMGLVFIAFRLRLPLDWSWCFIVQALLMITAGTMGFFFEPAWFFAIIAWALFFLFLIVPKILIKRCERNVGVLNYQATVSATKMLRYIYWGKIGKFWQDLYTASAFYLSGKVEAGDALISKWRAEKLPRSVSEQLDANRIGTFVLLGRWQDIIDERECRRETKNPLPHSFNVQVGRAYAELDDLERSAQALEAAKLPESRLTNKDVAMSLLPFFALIGANEQVETLSKILADEKDGLPDYLLEYWRGRCLAKQGKIEAAAHKYESVLARVKELATTGRANYEAWKSRLEKQIEAMRSQPAKFDPPGNAPDDHSARQPNHDQAKQALIARVWRIYEESGYVQGVVLPKRASPIVSGLVAAICLSYLASGAIDIVINISRALVLSPLTESFSHSALVAQMQNWSATQGTFALETFALNQEDLVNGQYWRLITYLFLHGSISHLLLNVMGLYWFGRIAVNIYGPYKFLLLFLFTGVVGGLTQVFSSSSTAIGASGGVLGIFGADAIAIFKLGDALPAKIRRYELTWMSVIAGSQLIIDHVIPQLTSIHIAGNAHLGGLLAGLALGFVLPLQRPTYVLSQTDGAKPGKRV